MGHSVGMDLPCASLAFIDGLGAPEMVLIFVLVLVLFGGQKLPEFARGLGKSIREFKKAAAGVEEEFKRALEEDERKHALPKLVAPATEPSAVTDPAPATDYDHGGPGYDDHSTITEDDPPAVQPGDAPVSPSTSTTPETEPTILPPAANSPPPNPTPSPAPTAPTVPPTPPPAAANSPAPISPPTPPAPPTPPPPGNPS